MALTLLKTSNSTFAFTRTGGLHPYFAVEDEASCSLTGLAMPMEQDRYDPTTDCKTFGRTTRLSASGFYQCMIWKPGTAGAQTMAGLPDDD